jgi:hypothetical protein
VSGQASAKQAHVASALRNICAFEDACGIKRAHLGFEGAVLELEATLDCKRGRQAGGRADVNCLSVGETTAAEGILVKKVAFFPGELDAAASLLDEERVLWQTRVNTAAGERTRKGIT